jgi:arginine decarboxylase
VKEIHGYEKGRGLKLLKADAVSAKRNPAGTGAKRKPARAG